MRICGTFLDEISHDIPSANWGPEEWSQDFDAMQSIGIDTVVLIRGGYTDHSTFDSEVLKKCRSMRPCYLDLVDLFLTQAQRCGMTFFFGTYDPYHYNDNRDPEQELQINLEFTREVIDRYGDREAFGGWYISREIDTYNPRWMKLFTTLATHLKSLKDVPILISPGIHGKKQFGNPITPKQHEQEWQQVFKSIQGLVDITAFQDGHVGFDELPTFMRINTSLAKEHGITPWSNVESFERGMPIDFLPIAWPHLRDKMETAGLGGAEKLITFEFSHFMSPNSMYPSAHNLFKRYNEWLKSEAGQEVC